VTVTGAFSTLVAEHTALQRAALLRHANCIWNCEQHLKFIVRWRAARLEEMQNVQLEYTVITRSVEYFAMEGESYLARCYEADSYNDTYDDSFFEEGEDDFFEEEAEDESDGNFTVPGSGGARLYASEPRDRLTLGAPVVPPIPLTRQQMALHEATSARRVLSFSGVSTDATSFGAPPRLRARDAASVGSSEFDEPQAAVQEAMDAFLS
jgi:hypothetical protein